MMTQPLQKSLDGTAVPTKSRLVFMMHRSASSGITHRVRLGGETGVLKLSPPTSVINAVCYLHLLVLLEAFPLAARAGLLLCLALRVLGVLLPALAVHRRGVHHYNPVRDGGGVWRCGVRHLLGLSRIQ